ncbi:integrase [Streptomyces sp. 8K308]|nr:integrase [Streptomyces sp. 8K308]
MQHHPHNRPGQSHPHTSPELRSLRLEKAHWDEVVVALGYEHLRRHDLRHTGLTWMADAGVKPHVLRLIAGHGSLATTQRYLHPDRRAIKEASVALGVHLAAGQDAVGPKVAPVEGAHRHLRVVR